MRWIFIAFAFFFVSKSLAQDTLRLSLPEIIKLAEINFPKLRANLYELEASRSNIQLQQQSLTPHLDASYQANVATANNISGMFFPQFVLPMTGPPSSGNDYSPITGSAASLLFQWQTGVFGDHKAQVNTAIAASKTLESKNAQEIFNHKVKLISQYINIVYYQHLIKLYEDNRSIAEKQLNQVKKLTATGLRPGIDSALIQSELSRTQIELLKVRNTYDNELASLQESIASDAIIVGSDTAFYNTIPEKSIKDITEHPFSKTARLIIEEGQTKLKEISKLTAPHLSFWGTTYARGSGINYTGSIKTFDGFNLNRFNYGAGVQLSVPLLNHAEIKTRLQQQSWIIKSDQEKLNQISFALNEQRKLSKKTFSNAMAVMRETPVLVHAAAYAFSAMQIRYTTGLVNYSELLQTQTSLLKAKIELTKSRAELWKALLFNAAVYGDLNLFINQVK